MKKKFLGLICLLYALIILFVNKYNILRNFLAPSMHIYLKIAVPLLLIIALVIFYSDEFHYKFKFTDLILILPLIMLIYAGDGRLTTGIASNKNASITVNKKVSKTNKKEEKEEKIKVDESKIDFDNIDFDVTDDIYVGLGNYFSAPSKNQKFIGKTIKVRGFTINDNSYLPSGYYGIGKYGVSCCVADAGFMGFVMKADDFKVKKSTWYEIEGYLDKTKDLSGADIYYINVKKMKEIDGKDEEEYIYACYQYGDEACIKLKEFGLEQ